MYAGNSIGWSFTKWAANCDCEFGMSMEMPKNIDLYPVMDVSDAALEGEDLTKGVWINSYDGTAIRMVTDFEGTSVDENYQLRDGKLVTLDGSKVVDTETGKVSDKPVEVKQEENKESANAQEQSSTVGGAGNSTVAESTGQINDGSVGELQEISPQAAAAKWGVAYLGSGNGGSTGADLGSGGYGLTFE